RLELVVVGPQRPGEEEVALGQADEHPSCRAQLARQVRADVGQQDPYRVGALARIGRQQSAIAGDLVGPRGRRRPGGEIFHRRVPNRWYGDAPRQDVIAVDEDVEAAGSHRVDDGQPARTIVDERL